jgi:HEAT repeat protein
MYPHERSLVKRLANEPFALIGVNSDPKEKVKAALERENISWRSFWDGGNTSGPIARAWSVRSWPTIYVIDDRGFIRYKNVRGESMDEAVDELLKKAIVTLVENIKSDDPALRGLAAFRMGKYNAPDAIELVRPVLEDEDESVRRRAATGLALLGEPAQPLLTLIRQAVEDEDADIRVAGIGILGNAKDKQSVELVSKALKDEVVDVRRTAISALGKLGDPDSIPAITEAVDDEDLETAKAAALALADMKSSKSLDALQELAAKADHPARVWIAVAMHRAGQEGTADRFKSLLEDEEEKVRQQTVDALSDLGDFDTTDLLIMALDDEAQPVGKAASKLLANIDSPKAKEALVKFQDKVIAFIVEGLSATNRAKQSQARSELSQLGPEAAPKLAAALKGDVPKMPALYLAQAICNSGDQEAIQLLKETAADKDAPVRVHVAYALSMIKDKDTFSDLMELAEAVKGDDMPPLIYGLGNYPSKESTAVLAKILEENASPQTRMMTIIALSRQNSSEAAIALGKFVDDEEAMIKQRVLSALRGMQSPEAKKILEEYQKKEMEKKEKEKQDKEAEDDKEKDKD